MRVMLRRPRLFRRLLEVRALSCFSGGRCRDAFGDMVDWICVYGWEQMYMDGNRCIWMGTDVYGWEQMCRRIGTRYIYIYIYIGTRCVSE